MAIAPNSVVHFLTVPINFNNQMTFGSRSEQSTYFQSLKEGTVTSGSNYTYIKKDNIIRVEESFDDLIKCNYVMYQNTSYSSKWFYAFIVNIQYINDKTTHVQIVTDSWQTYQFDITFRNTFIERMHIPKADDIVGNYILDEGLPTGEYQTNAYRTKYFTDFYLIIGSTVDLTSYFKEPRGAFDATYGGMYSKIYSGVAFYAFDMDDTYVKGVIPSLLHLLATDQKLDSIVTMYMLPKELTGEVQTTYSKLSEGVRPVQEVSIPNSNTISGYTPKNKKLMTYPYRALVVSNNEGNVLTLKYENFSIDNPSTLYYQGTTTPNGRITLFPRFYKTTSENMNESISVGNYPQCCWLKDVYAQWYAQQSIRWGYQKDRMVRDTIMNVGQMALTGVAMGAMGATAESMTSQGINMMGGVTGQVAKFDDFYSKMNEETEVHSLIPPSVGGTIGNGNTNIGINKYGFLIEEKTVKVEYAKVIDDFFTMFGYKIKRIVNLSTNTFKSRSNHNYIKTIGMNIGGKIPIIDKNSICQMFNEGVTFWHNPSTFGNYQVDNN